MDSAVRQMMRANEENWDTRTPVHVASEFYAQDPAYWFSPYEWDDLGDLDERELLHLQCHIGADTVEFARRGARVTGVDISAESLTHARRIAKEHEVDIDFVHSNVYDVDFSPERFEIVYTAKGSLCYLPDLARWATLVASLLKPGGVLYVAEFHPLLNAFGPAPKPGLSEDLVLRHDYLEGRGPQRKDSQHTYTDGPALSGATVSYEWAHGLGEVISAVAGAGLRVTTVRESSELPWPRWSRMVRNDRGWWELPADEPRVPLFYSLRAEKP